MAYSRDRGISPTRRIWDRLAADRKKTTFAVALLAVMAVMWVRVLTGQRPDVAGAETGPAQEQPAAHKAPRDIRYLKLPNVPGRNDYINRDFFAARDWECFRQGSPSPRKSPGTEAVTASVDRGREMVARVAKKLELTAVMRDGNPRAFINDELLRVGDRLLVRDGPDLCEFEVLRINNDSVLLRCKGTQLTLKLTQHLDVSK
jgi:hypothetical protein